MAISRVIQLLVVWAILAAVSVKLVPHPEAVLDFRVAAFVLFLPWVTALASHPGKSLALALRDAFKANVDDIHVDARRESAAILCSLGGLSLATGIVGLFATILATTSAMATSVSAPVPVEVAGSIGLMVLAPIYGLALKAFFYDPLALRLEGTPGLGAELEC